MNIPLVFLYSFLAALSCATASKHSAEAPAEYVRVRMTSYRIANDKATPYLSFANNVWYEDSVGITQISGLQSLQEGARDTIYAVTLGYRFTDMRRKWAYEYRNLYDTAEIVRKYLQPDSLPVVGGWGFYRPAAIQFDSLRSVGDTSIGGVTYLKHRYIQYFQGKQFLSEVLSRCDKKGSIFQLDLGVSNATGCPMVKGSTMTPDGRFPMSSVGIEFISNEFPDSVRRVFAAWKRNVELYPVQ